MITYEAPLGERIEVTAAKLVALAKSIGDDCQCEFNGVLLSANPRMVADDIAGIYRAWVEKSARELISKNPPPDIRDLQGIDISGGVENNSPGA